MLVYICAGGVAEADDREETNPSVCIRRRTVSNGYVNDCAMDAAKYEQPNLASVGSRFSCSKSLLDFIMYCNSWQEIKPSSATMRFTYMAFKLFIQRKSNPCIGKNSKQGRCESFCKRLNSLLHISLATTTGEYSNLPGTDTCSWMFWINQRSARCLVGPPNALAKYREDRSAWLTSHLIDSSATSFYR